MSAEQPVRIERGQVWRQRGRGRLVVITAVRAGVVAALDPERIEEAVLPEPRFRARFEYVGVAPRDPDPDGPPSPVDAATLCGLERRPTTWLRELAAVADERGAVELARLAREVLALRGENPGTREAPNA